MSPTNPMNGTSMSLPFIRRAPAAGCSRSRRCTSTRASTAKLTPHPQPITIQIPNPHRPITTRRSEPSTVVVECHVEDIVEMAVGEGLGCGDEFEWFGCGGGGVGGGGGSWCCVHGSLVEMDVSGRSYVVEAWRLAERFLRFCPRCLLCCPLSIKTIWLSRIRCSFYRHKKKLVIPSHPRPSISHQSRLLSVPLQPTDNHSTTATLSLGGRHGRCGRLDKITSVS